jgi:phospholipase C
VATLLLAVANAAVAGVGMHVAQSDPGPRVGRCPFQAGARVEETLHLTASQRAAIPITHVIVLMQENRSFDHYFGRLSQAPGGQPEAEGFPAGFTNPDRQGRPTEPFHLPTTCVPRDPPHQWNAMRAHWNGGRMNGFVTSAAAEDGEGSVAMGFYDHRDLPFYHWLASTFALGDRHFAAAMGGTWPNRQFLYAGTAQTPRSSTGQLLGARTLFDALDEQRVGWRVYKDGPPHQDCIGWEEGARGVEGHDAFSRALATGTLPPVSFLDPNLADEHPPADVQRGETWARDVYRALLRSPLWPRLALIFTYDEGGGFFDHVPPPAACAPDESRAELNRRGTRVPLMVISPWARPHHVSHVVHDHASILRFIELLHDVPALSARDANADALLDMFDFTGPPRLMEPPPPPMPGRQGCKAMLVAEER